LTCASSLFPVKLYDHFCLSLYRHDEKIILWQAEMPSQVNGKALFLKSIKPNLKEYKAFCNDTGWLPFRESLEATILSHHLSEMIASPFTIDPNTGKFAVDPIAGERIPCEPEDYGFNEMQRVWFYKVLCDICLTPVAKKIVNQICESKDARKVWDELCTHNENSMQCPPNFAVKNYYGMCTKTNSRIQTTVVHINCTSLVSPRPFINPKLSDQMCVDFLNNSMRGTTHLEGALDACCTAKQASGHPDPCNITFEEYVERFIQATQPHDASLGQSRGRGSRSANLHSMLGG